MANVNKIACVLVLDASMSMQSKKGNWRRIDALNAAIEQGFCYELKNDLSTKKAVDVAIVKVSDSQATVVQDWVVAKDFDYQPLTTSGCTPLYGGFKLAVDLCEKQKKHYLSEGIDYYRPWIILVTDGSPTDDENKTSAIKLAEDVRKKKKALVMCVAVDGGKKELLEPLRSEDFPVAELSSHHFQEYFLFLSSSLSATSQSSDGSLVMDPEYAEQCGLRKIL